MLFNLLRVTSFRKDVQSSHSNVSSGGKFTLPTKPILAIIGFANFKACCDVTRGADVSSQLSEVEPGQAFNPFETALRDEEVARRGQVYKC